MPEKSKSIKLSKKKRSKSTKTRRTKITQKKQVQSARGGALKVRQRSVEFHLSRNVAYAYASVEDFSDESEEMRANTARFSQSCDLRSASRQNQVYPYLDKFVRAKSDIIL
eukprot:TRINITY_DN1086_c0_g1_i1.p1 TRINITY_DN1086_c0_g1~~TRINITY_DN1086_c0_g1_i1.p1  ORF type:complete len:111 (-),score=15.92 TRINITY_DN1086_c0_g1_i1:80-412(-)